MTHAGEDLDGPSSADAVPVATASRPAGDADGASGTGAAETPGESTGQRQDAQARPGPQVDPFVLAARAAARVSGSRAWVRHVLLLLAFEVAGVLATWPLTSFLFTGTLPATEDTGAYVWDMWWVGHHVLAPGQIFYTNGMAAPIGMHMGFSTMMPLAGILLAPITLTAGPAVSLILLYVITPGLLCYAMFRLARLWLNAPGAIAAGAFFGLSSTLAWRDWFHINVALGTVFLPLAIEAAIRFRRTMAVREGIYLGVVLGASVMINQQTFVIAVIIVGLITATWVLRLLIHDVDEMVRRLPALLAAIGGVLVIGGLQFLAMVQQMSAGGASPPANILAQSWTMYGASLPSMFGPSPRLADHGLGGLSSSYNFNYPLEGLPTYGIVLSVIAVLGIAVGWRHRTTWWFAATWLVGSVLTLGTSLIVSTTACAFDPLHQGVLLPAPGCKQFLPLASVVNKIQTWPPGLPSRWVPISVSNLMPYSWLVKFQGLSGLREADRFIFVGLVGAALLAGLTVQWLSQRRVSRPLIAVVAAAGMLEAGWAGAGALTMPSSIPQVGQTLAQDHSDTIVVDVPYGLRGGLPLVGQRLMPWELMAATTDGHRRAISFTAWVSGRTSASVQRHAFYYRLLRFEALGGARYYRLTPEQIANIKADYRKMKVGTVVEWMGSTPGTSGAQRTWPAYLTKGHFDYQNVAGFLTEIGMKRTSVICIAGPKTGCPLPDQVWIWKPAS